MASKITLGAKGEPLTPSVGYGRLFFDKVEMVWKIKHDNGLVAPLEVTPNENIRVVNQTIDDGAGFYDPVYFDNGVWYRATGSTARPMGVRTTNDGEVVLFGKMTVYGFFSNKYYFLKTLGGVSIDESQTYIKIGYTIDSNTLLVDIDAEQNA